jgi:tetratricopeptide (TPR) repeat protein
MSVNLQAQIRDNSRDLNAFLRDLNEWTGDVKEKDAALSSGDARDVPASASSSGRAEPPPVRGRVAEHVVASEADLKARRKESRAAAPAPSPASAARTETPARDGSNDGAAPKTKTTTSLTHKDLGNAAFKTGEYESAIEHYTRSLQEDGETAVAYANRSMSYLKLERWAEAERDASAALKIDASYLKAHQRRGVARRRLGKFLEATMDYENALLLEPNSKVLREDRAACKSAHEKQANVRVTVARRAVPVIIPTRGDDADAAPAPASVPDERETPPASPRVPEAVRDGRVRETSGRTPLAVAGDEAEKTENVPPKAAAAPAASKTAAAAARASPASGGAGGKPLATPRTCAEFEAAWKRVKSDPEDTRRRALLASIAPRDVPTLFRGGVPTNVFPGVVAAALGEPAFVELLEALTQTPRFDVAVLFVAGAAKKAMTRAWDEAIAAAKEGDAAARLAEARKAYKA